MKLNNAKFRVAVPHITVSNIRAHLTLLNTLNAVEFGLFLLLPFFILFAQREYTQLYNWVGIIYLMLLVRVIKFLYFGVRAFPNVEFDLRLLFVITFVLISTIVQGDEQTYSNLGGTNIIGVGLLMLAALSLYLLVVTYRSYSYNRFIFHAFNTAVTLFLLGNILSGRSDVELADLNNFSIALTCLIMNFTALGYFKNSLVKVQIGLGLLVSFIAVVLGMSWENFTLIAVSLPMLGVFTLISRNAPALPRVLRDLFSLNYSLVALALAVVSGFLLWAGYMTSDVYAKYLDGILDSYLNLDLYLSEIQEIALGLSLRLYDTTLGALVISYGLVGLTFLIFMLIHVVGKSIKQTNALLETKSIATMQFAFLSTLFLIFGLGTIENLSVIAFFVLIQVFVLVYSFEPVTYADVKGGISKISNSDKLRFDVVSRSGILNKLFKPEIWQDIFSNTRLVVAVALVILSPSILEFIKELF